MPIYLQFAPRAFNITQRREANWKQEKNKGRIDNLKTEARQATRKTKGFLRCLWRRAHKQTLYIHLQRVTSSFINSFFFFLIIQQVKLVDISSFPGSRCVQALQAVRETVRDSRQCERMLSPLKCHERKKKRNFKLALKGGTCPEVVCTIF